jgi:MoaA/NifB/PqqE/SkfB family radical SAM enzyme
MVQKISGKESLKKKNTFTFDGAEIFGILSWFLTKSERGTKIASVFLDRYLSVSESRLFQRLGMKKYKQHPALRIAQRILKELNPRCRRAFINNFLVNAVLEGGKKRYRVVNGKREVLAPFTVLISPTMRCNLRCENCYAGEYSRKDDLEIEVIDRIIREGKEMGVYLYTILGGEPFLRSDLFEVYEKHPDAVFQVFTNGYLLDEVVCQHISSLGNIAPMISIEGFEKETDRRRGEGTFERALKAIRLLKERGVFFGISVVPTKLNTEVVTSDEFIDFILGEGAFALWYFLYMPVGREPDLSLMPTPEQRNKIRLAAERIRAQKPLLVVDFWGDAPLVGGCIAGREYIHINSKGDVEPCIFCHFAVDNIKEKNLKEVFHSQFMKNIRKRIPYSPNLLKPCMIIDNPHVLHEVCGESNPRPTHPGMEKLLHEFVPALKNYAEEVSKVYDPVWEVEFKEEKESLHKTCSG